MIEPFAEPTRTDPVPFRVASGMTEISAQPTPANPALSIPTNINEAAFTAQINGAVHSLREAGVRHEEFDPETSAIFGAAFRQGNTIGSALASKSLAEKLFPSSDDRGLTDDELIDKVKADGMAANIGPKNDWLGHGLEIMVETIGNLVGAGLSAKQDITYSRNGHSVADNLRFVRLWRTRSNCTWMLRLQRHDLWRDLAKRRNAQG